MGHPATGRTQPTNQFRYTTAMTTAPAIRGIVETCINVSDMTRARRFYESLFGFEAMAQDEALLVPEPG
jgi:catechol-2,3-dioxygenase